MAEIGRNEPCPCGSGKKYKKCCMPKQTAIDLDSFREKRAEENLRNEIVRFATGQRFKDEMVEAFSRYHENKIDTSLLFNQDSLENIRFLDWFINDYRHSTEQKRIIELFAEQRAKNLEDEQKKLLDEWTKSHLGAFVIDSIGEGVVTLTDLFRNESHAVEDASAADEIEAGEIIVARLTSSGGKKKLAGAPIVLSVGMKEKLKASVDEAFAKYREEHPEAQLQEFLADHTHVLNIRAGELAREPMTS